MANLVFNYSTMNSGKTLELLRKAFSYNEVNLNVIILKPFCDTKGNNQIVTRLGLKRKVDYLIKEEDSILELLKNDLDNVSCIFVDEAQFLNSNQIDELYYISKFYNIEVFCYGLRDNFKMQLFDGSKRLFEVADELVSYDSRCKCGNNAKFSARKVNGEYVNEGDEVLIDGSSSDVVYEPICGECYLKKVKKLTNQNILRRK